MNQLKLVEGLLRKTRNERVTMVMTRLWTRLEEVWRVKEGWNRFIFSR